MPLRSLRRLAPWKGGTLTALYVDSRFRIMDTFSPKDRSRVMSKIRGRDTAPELLVRSILHRLGFRFRLHRKDLAGTPDLVLPSRRSVIFVHGCFWHGHDCSRGGMPSSNVCFWTQKIGKNKDRDSRVQQQLRSEGWNVLTIWQCETKDISQLERRLTRFLQSSPQQQGMTA
jgi:DNA mismatch endonuclease, patch repair protein